MTKGAIIIFFSLSIFQGIFSQNAHQLLNQAQKNYNIGEYKKAITLLEPVIIKDSANYSNDNLELTLHVYTLIADAYFRLNNLNTSIEILDDFIQKRTNGQKNTSYLTRAKLKKAQLYYDDKKYSEAYSELINIPQSSSDEIYTNEALKLLTQIDKLKSGNIKGKVSINKDDYKNTEIKLFNGFAITNAKLNQTGEFNIPVYGSTIGTYLSLFVIVPGYEPYIKNMVLDSSLLKKTLQITPSISKKNKGYLVGVTYTTLKGGKIQQRQGISGYSQLKNIQVSKSKNNKVMDFESETNGIHIIPLKTGNYKVTVNKYNIEENIQIRKNTVIFLNIPAGHMYID